MGKIITIATIILKNKFLLEDMLAKKSLPLLLSTPRETFGKFSDICQNCFSTLVTELLKQEKTCWVLSFPRRSKIDGPNQAIFVEVMAKTRFLILGLQFCPFFMLFKGIVPPPPTPHPTPLTFFLIFFFH